MVATDMKKSLEHNGYTLRVTVSSFCQQKPFNFNDFKFSYFDSNLQESWKISYFHLLIFTVLNLHFQAGLELLSLAWGLIPAGNIHSKR